MGGRSKRTIGRTGVRCGGSRSGDVRNKGRKQRRKGRVPGEGSGGGKLGSVQGGEVDGALEELLALRYERLVPMLLGAVKELTSQVEDLKSRLESK